FAPGSSPMPGPHSPSSFMTKQSRENPRKYPIDNRASGTQKFDRLVKNWTRRERRGTSMEFGITFKGFIEAERARYLVRAAEYAGFSYCWFYDSHILWRDCYAAIAMCMEHTTDMRFGPLVTNPDVRDWSVAASIFGSLSKQSGGRFDLAVGRGDSSMRVMGKKPATLKRVAEFIEKTQAM